MPDDNMLGKIGRCICQRWPLYVGIYDRHGHTVRCYGCKRIPNECLCRFH